MATRETSRLQAMLGGLVAVLIGIVIGMLISGGRALVASDLPWSPERDGVVEESAPGPSTASEPEAAPEPELPPEVEPDPLLPLLPEWTAGDGTTMVAIAVAWERSCGVWDDGSLQCWGEDFGEVAVASGGLLLREVSLGDYHGCGITTEGATRCWGTIEGRPFASPRLPLVSLRASGKQQCGLDMDGRVVCWGLNPSIDRTFGRGFVTFDVGLHGAICGIDAEGAISCDGGIPGPLVPPDDRFVRISVGETRACGITVDGEVLCFGPRTYEQRQESFDGVRFVQAGVANDGGCNLREDGGLRCWGRLAAAGAVPVRGPLSAIAVGESHSCAISVDGMPVCWGSNSRGQARPPVR